MIKISIIFLISQNPPPVYNENKIYSFLYPTMRDAHTHLNHPDLFSNREKYLESFTQEWGLWLVNIWANTEYNENALTIAKQAKSKFAKLWIKASIGIHPCDVRNTSQDIQTEYLKLQKQLVENREHIVAIGECGIDLYYPEVSSYLTLQQEIFKMQCDLARENQLPIVIHSRDAFQETFDILKNYSDLKIYFHCWSYNKEELEILLSTFPKIWIGYNGILTYPKSHENRECLLATPLNNIVLETDAPYLAPQGFRGKINHPELIKVVGKYASEILNIEEDILRKQIGENTKDLYIS